MGGIYTSKRSIAHDPLFYRAKNTVGSNLNVWVDQVNPTRPFAAFDSQETTSYRSRGRLGDDEVGFQPGHPNFSQEAFETWIRENFPQNPPRSEGLRAQATVDKGHPFSTTKVYRSYGPMDPTKPVTWRWTDGSTQTTVEHNHPFVTGQYFHNGTWYGTMDDPNPSAFITSNDTVSGNEAIAATAPTRPAFSLGNAAAELLREGIPALAQVYAIKNAADALRAAGGNYLNVQFGWTPLVRDIQGLIKTLLNASDILEKYQAGSGQQTRRRWHLRTLERNEAYTGLNVRSFGCSSRSVRNDGNFSTSSGGLMALLSTANHEVIVSAKQERWFSGAYTYFLPDEGSFDHFRSLANKLLGVELTPEVLWNLAPWSWLIDWVTGIGANVAAAQRFQHDNLVLRYGYLMVRDRVTVTTTFNFTGTSPGGAPFTRPGFTRVHYDRKRRVRSTPFGFGLNPSTDFNPFQWSILAALGMTKAPRTLR